MKKSGKKYIKWDNERFAKLWNKAKSVGEMSKKMGVSKLQAYMQAQALRRRGVRLKKFSPGRPKVTK